jgi:hypothetical protein
MRKMVLKLMRDVLSAPSVSQAGYDQPFDKLAHAFGIPRGYTVYLSYYQAERVSSSRAMNGQYIRRRSACPRQSAMLMYLLSISPTPEAASVWGGGHDIQIRHHSQRRYRRNSLFHAAERNDSRVGHKTVYARSGRHGEKWNAAFGGDIPCYVVYYSGAHRQHHRMPVQSSCDRVYRAFVGVYIAAGYYICIGPVQVFCQCAVCGVIGIGIKYGERSCGKAKFFQKGGKLCVSIPFYNEITRRQRMGLAALALHIQPLFKHIYLSLKFYTVHGLFYSFISTRSIATIGRSTFLLLEKRAAFHITQVKNAVNKLRGTGNILYNQIKLCGAKEAGLMSKAGDFIKRHDMDYRDIIVEDQLEA